MPRSVLLLCLAFSFSGSAVASGTPHFSLGSAHPVPAWLVKLAYRTATQNGDSRPTEVQYVIRKKQAIVTLHGHFVCRVCSRPAGAKAPRGTLIRLVVSAGSRQIESYALTSR